jgi:hypothetical protein
MKKYFTLFLCIYSFHFVHAQSWYLGVQANYGWLMYSEKTNDALSGLNDQLISRIDAQDTYNFGIRLTKDFNENLGIISGISFDAKKELCADCVDLSIDKYMRKYSYATVPLGVQYTLNTSKKLKPFVSIALETAYLIKSTETIRFTGDNRDQYFSNKVDLNSIVCSSQMRVGFDKKIDEKTKFSFYMQQQSNINSITNSLIEKRWHSLQAGIAFRHMIGGK